MGCMKSLTVSAVTDRGHLRARNKDAIAVGPLVSQVESGSVVTVTFTLNAPVVLAVADGLGGHPAGNVASWLVVTELAEVQHEWETSEDIERGVLDLHTSVRRAATTAAELQGMGTTFAGLVATPGTLHCVNVGDSPIYRINDHDVEPLSTNDAVIDASGRATHAISQVIGSQISPAPHVRELTPFSGRYLVCSDGVSGFVNKGDILRACRGVGPSEALHQLVDVVVSNGAPDNYSALLVDI